MPRSYPSDMPRSYPSQTPAISYAALLRAADVLPTALHASLAARGARGIRGGWLAGCVVAGAVPRRSIYPGRGHMGWRVAGGCGGWSLASQIDLTRVESLLYL
jgi:hypothetical protein